MMNYMRPFLLLLCLVLVIPDLHAQWFGRRNNADELYEQAVQETNRKNYQKAVELSLEALKKRPDFIDMELLLGRLYMLTGDWNAARQRVNNVLKRDPKYLDAHYYRINIEVSTRQYDAAIRAVDAALAQFSGRKDLMLRKLGVLDAAGYLIQGNLFAEELLQRFPADREVQRAYAGHYVENARHYRRQQLPSAALASLEKALAADPGNPEARELLDAPDLNTYNRHAALEVINLELEANPGSADLLLKKLSLLRDMQRYAEALSVLQTIYRHHPDNAQTRAMETELRMEAAAFYTQTDPYMLYQSVLERDPGNMEALRKVIGLSNSRGAYREAMAWVNQGLRRNPQSEELLALKLDLLEDEQKYTEAAQVAGQLWKRRPASTELRNRYAELKAASARYYTGQQQYEPALAELRDALSAVPNDTLVLEGMVNAYSSQRNYEQALVYVDRRIAAAPDDSWLLRRAGLLAEAGRYDDAAGVLEDLMRRNPGRQQYVTAYTGNRLLAGSRLLQQDELVLASGQLRAVLAADPANRDALNYLINLYSAADQPDSALYFADRALAVFPDDREFLLKKSSVLTTMGRYSEAGELAGTLMRRYPYTVQYRNAYTDNLLSAAAQYRRINQPDSAVYVYSTVLEVNPKDSLALLNLANMYLERQQYDSAEVYTRQALRWYPEHAGFRLRQAQVYEGRKDFAAAAAAADTAVVLRPSADNRDYADFLRSRTLRNQFGLHFLRTTYDYSESNYDIATLEYMRFFSKGSFGGRINYAGRERGTGLQGEAELYYTHSTNWYSYALAAYANEVVFPQWRLGYTLFRTFRDETEVGLGARYLKRDTMQNVSALLSLVKVYGDFWLNLRAYGIFEQRQEAASSFALSARYYMNRRQDFLSVTAALGTSPDDRSRLIQFTELSGLLTRSVGAGYQRTFRYRTILGINTTWITQKIDDQLFQNQYDLYFTIMRRF